MPRLVWVAPTTAERLFLVSGLIWTGTIRAYWISLLVRITIELQLPSLQLVLLGTVMELSLLLAEVPTGVMADTISRKWSVVIACVGVGGAQIGAGLASSFGLLLVAQVVWGVSYSFRSGAETAWITDELGGPEAVESLYLRRARLQLVVSVLSVLVGAGLARLTSLSTSIVVAGVLLVGWGLVLAIVMPETGFTRTWQAGSAKLATAVGSLRTTLRAGARVTGRSRSLRILVAVLILSGLGSEVVDRLGVARLDDLGLSAELDEIVVVAALASAEAILGAVVLWWSANRLTGTRVAAGMGTLLAVAAVGIAALGLVAVLPVAMAGLVVQGGLRTAAQPLAVTWTNAHAPSEVRATVHSFVEQANSVGEIGGGIALGALAAATTVPTAMTAATALIALAAFLALTRHPT